MHASQSVFRQPEFTILSCRSIGVIAITFTCMQAHLLHRLTSPVLPYSNFLVLNTRGEQMGNGEELRNSLYLCRSIPNDGIDIYIHISSFECLPPLQANVFAVRCFVVVVGWSVIDDQN